MVNSLGAYGQLNDGGVRLLADGKTAMDHTIVNWVSKLMLVWSHRGLAAQIFKLFPKTQPVVWEKFKSLGEQAALPQYPRALERLSYKYLKQANRSFASNYEVMKEFMLEVFARSDEVATLRGFYPSEAGFQQHWGGVLGMCFASYLEMEKQMSRVLGVEGTAADHAYGRGRHDNLKDVTFPQLEFWRYILATTQVCEESNHPCFAEVKNLPDEPTMELLAKDGPVKEYICEMCLSALPPMVQLAAVQHYWRHKSHAMKPVVKSVRHATEVTHELLLAFFDQHMLRHGGMFEHHPKRGHMSAGNYAKHPYQGCVSCIGLYHV